MASSPVRNRYSSANLMWTPTPPGTLALVLESACCQRALFSDSPAHMCEHFLRIGFEGEPARMGKRGSGIPKTMMPMRIEFDRQQRRVVCPVFEQRALLMKPGQQFAV